MQDLGALRLAILNGEGPKDIIPVVDTVLTQLRSLSSELHPAGLNLFGLSTALEQLAHQNEQEGTIQVKLSSSAPERLDPQVGIVLFRIAQEALSNARKHSSARQVWIRLDQGNNALTLEVQDNGKGFDVEPVLRRAVQTDHLGLAMLHELALSIRGNLRIISRPGHGTTITVSVHHSGSGAQSIMEQLTYRKEENRSLT